MNNFLLISIMIGVPMLLNGQDNVYAWESNIAGNYSFKSWKLNTSISHRTLQREVANETETFWAFWDINQFITRKVGSRLSVSFGYKFRELRPSEKLNRNEQRLTQQFAFTHLKEQIRLVSRFRSEQRFISNDLTHRFRYRFSLDMPLNGLRLNEKEFYLLLSNEFLYELSDDSSEFDNRINTGIGYVFSSTMKAQVDYTLRTEAINEETDNVSFFTTSIILSF